MKLFRLMLLHELLNTLDIMLHKVAVNLVPIYAVLYTENFANG